MIKKLLWDVKEPTHYSKRIGREVPGVVNTGPMLIVVSITKVVILYKHVKIIIWTNKFGVRSMAPNMLNTYHYNFKCER